MNNWLLFLVLAILIGYAIYGRYRGFIKTVFMLFSTIVALILTIWISPVISDQVQQNDKIMNYVTQKVSKVVDAGKMGNKKTDELNFIGKLKLPKTMKNALIENNTADVYKAMAVDNFKQYVSNSISRIIINAAVFLAIMLIVTIGFAVLCEALNIISKLPLINGLNKTAGLFAGVLQGIIIIWIGCIFLTMLSSTSLGQSMFTQINESPFLSTIYNNNLLLKFVTNLGTILLT
jgi:uncharacterized membrane protein required for colicin V production